MWIQDRDAASCRDVREDHRPKERGLSSSCLTHDIGVVVTVRLGEDDTMKKFPCSNSVQPESPLLEVRTRQREDEGSGEPLAHLDR